jgi:hypothetical protein
MFLFCYHTVKEQCPQAYLRLQMFLNLYGFSRSMSFAAFGVAAMLAFAGALKGNAHLALLGGVTLVASVSLFARYLKFFRHYSVEVFTSFWTSVPENPSNSPTRS